MPDGISIRSVDQQRIQDVFQRLNRWVKPFWEHRLTLIGSACYAAAMTAPQTAEFMDNALLSCFPMGECAPHTRYASPMQFVMFVVLALCFSLLLWRLGLLADGRGAPSGVRPRAARFASWLPVGAGAGCLLVMCEVLIANTNHLSKSWHAHLMPAMSLVLGVLAAHTLRSGGSGNRWSVVLGSVGMGLSALRPFSPSLDEGNLFVPALFLFAAFVCSSYGARLRKLEPYPRLLGCVMVCVAVLQLTLIFWKGTFTIFSGSVWTWTFPLLLMGPFLFAMLVASCRYRSPRMTPVQGVDLGSPYPLPRGSGWERYLLWVPIAVFAGIALIGNQFPINAAQWIVAPSAMVAFIAVILLMVTAFVRWIPRPIRWFALIAYLCMLFAHGVPAAPVKGLYKPIAGRACVDAPSICNDAEAIVKFWTSWEQYHPAASDAPVLLVAAAGGGARAAVHTSAVLAAVDAATCGAFGDRIFAISGVSGGAVGGALYAASRTDLVSPSQWEHCRRLPPGERPAPLLSRLVDTASGDHLSAPLLQALFRDLPASLFLPARDEQVQGMDDYASRAGVLQQSWANSYRRLLPPATGRNPVADSFSGTVAQERGKSPLMLFNATSVQDGTRVLLNSASVCPEDGWCSAQGSNLGMALDSARFPLITPAKAHAVYGWETYSGAPIVSERAVVDGGYFDNTGVASLLNVMDGLAAAKVRPDRIFAILITSDPQEGDPPDHLPDYSDQGPLSQLLGPVSTVIRTRDGRSRLALQELRRRLPRCNVLYWTLSRKSLNPLTNDMRKALGSNPEGDALRELYGKPELIIERKPALGWALSDRSGAQLERFARARALPFEYGSFAHANDRKLSARLGQRNASQESTAECEPADDVLGRSSDVVRSGLEVK